VELETYLIRVVRWWEIRVNIGLYKKELKGNMLRMDEIEDLEIAYVASFAHKIEKPWGLLFWNEDNPGYYDANHAHIRCIPNNPKLVVEEVVMFYREKHITPRFYIYNIENQNELIVELKATGFNFEEFDDSLQLWDNVLGEKDIDNKIIIEQVNKNNFTGLFVSDSICSLAVITADFIV